MMYLFNGNLKGANVTTARFSHSVRAAEYTYVSTSPLHCKHRNAMERERIVNANINKERCQ